MPTQTFFDLHPKKQDRILNAARQVFANAPYEKASIQAIIRAAEIPRGSFYQYFNDKEDLYLYLLQTGSEKIIRLTYRDNMDFFWNMLYDSRPGDRETAPWYNTALIPHRQALSPEEYQFLTKSTPPANLLRASFARNIHLMYPFFLRYIQDGQLTNSKKDSQLLAFLFSTIDLLDAEYGQLTDCSSMEAFTDIRQILLTFYEAIRRKDKSFEYPFSHAYSSIHLFSPGGVDLTAAPLPGTKFVHKAEGKAELWELAIVFGSLKGTFPLHTESLVYSPFSKEDTNAFPRSSAADPSAVLTLELQGKELVSCRFCTHEISYNLGSDLTLIAVNSERKREVLIESGTIL